LGPIGASKPPFLVMLERLGHGEAATELQQAAALDPLHEEPLSLKAEIERVPALDAKPVTHRLRYGDLALRGNARLGHDPISPYFHFFLTR
jgi:hypothetical protein